MLWIAFMSNVHVVAFFRCRSGGGNNRHYLNSSAANLPKKEIEALWRPQYKRSLKYRKRLVKPHYNHYKYHQTSAVKEDNRQHT